MAYPLDPVRTSVAQPFGRNTSRSGPVDVPSCERGFGSISGRFPSASASMFPPQPSTIPSAGTVATGQTLSSSATNTSPGRYMGSSTGPIHATSIGGGHSHSGSTVPSGAGSGIAGTSASAAVPGSDSSAASSPDIASLLPPRHHWNATSASASSSSNHPHANAHANPNTTNPYPHPHAPSVHPALAAASWYNPNMAMPSASPVSPVASSYDMSLAHEPGAHGSALGDFGQRSFDSAQRDHPKDARYAHPQRHHPYMPESSLVAYRRALGLERPPPNGSTGPSRVESQPPAPQAPPKSGRLGVKRRQKYTRSRTGCLGCRQRRIKCDEGRPVCRRCQVAKRECNFPEPEGKKGKGKESDDDNEGETTPTPSAANSSLPDSKPTAPATDTSTSPNFDFDISQAFPEGFGNDEHPLGWDRGFTTETGSTVVTFDNTLVGSSEAEPSSATALQAPTKDRYEVDETPLLSTPNFLLPWFPTAQEQSLILHYCANAADLMMAIPSGLNPMLAINLPLALGSPRGTNPAADALRVVLLGIGAIHQAFLLARSGMSTTQTTATFQYASNLRDLGKEMVQRACMTDSANSDAALSAGTCLATMDIFFGGSGWQDNFALTKKMVRDRGGPRKMLKDATPTLLADGVTVMPPRVFLEILSIYETFGCLTQGLEPELIPDEDSWWFESSGSTYENRSVEAQFGMSRIMVHLFSRVARLLARIQKNGGAFLAEPPKEDLFPSSVVPPNLLPTSSAKGLEADAAKLSRDIDTWIASLAISTVEHERVQVGNRAYAHAMKILLWRNVFGRPRDDPDVQAAAQEVLQHCSISTAALGMSIDLTWPSVLAGCVVDGSARDWLLTLLEGFKAQCCFDVDTASRIVAEVWRRVDAGEPGADWKPVCDDLGLKVLLC